MSHVLCSLTKYMHAAKDQSQHFLTGQYPLHLTLQFHYFPGAGNAERNLLDSGKLVKIVLKLWAAIIISEHRNNSGLRSQISIFARAYCLCQSHANGRVVGTGNR